MNENGSFHLLIKRVREGDQEAWMQICDRYASAIRCEARLRLRSQKLRRIIDSNDALQIVLKTFFLHAALGEYDLDTPEKLLALLVRITRNRVVNLANRENAACHGGKVEIRSLGERGTEQAFQLAAPDADPHRQVASREFLDVALSRFSAQERKVAELRGQGCDWNAIAVQLGGSPDGRRMQHRRAVERVSREFGLGENLDDE